MKCAAHPDVETNLRCGKCGTPICPRCMVQTPVGARCPACARLYKLPTFHVSPVHYLKAAAVSLGAGLLGGGAWFFLDSLLRGFLSLVIAGALGYAIGELVSLSVNRKRGTGLAAISGAGVVVSYLVTILLRGYFPSGLLNIGYDILAVALGIYFAANRLR